MDKVNELQNPRKYRGSLLGRKRSQITIDQKKKLQESKEGGRCTDQKDETFQWGFTKKSIEKKKKTHGGKVKGGGPHHATTKGANQRKGGKCSMGSRGGGGGEEPKLAKNVHL